jgi:hypothetical protein
MKTERIIVEVPSCKLHVEHARCPQGHSLMDASMPISGFPSVKVLLQYGSLRGNVHLDPVYGSFHNVFDIDLPDDVVVRMFCPVCDMSLEEANSHCDYCFSPMFALYLPNGGILEGCTKNGCHKHKLRLVNVDEQLGALHGPDHIQLLM